VQSAICNLVNTRGARLLSERARAHASQAGSQVCRPGQDRTRQGCAFGPVAGGRISDHFSDQGWATRRPYCLSAHDTLRRALRFPNHPALLLVPPGLLHSGSSKYAGVSIHLIAGLTSNNILDQPTTTIRIAT
jgi:hypothetical protein